MSGHCPTPGISWVLPYRPRLSRIWLIPAVAAIAACLGYAIWISSGPLSPLDLLAMLAATAIDFVPKTSFPY